jgi:hypothetical protein
MIRIGQKQLDPQVVASFQENAWVDTNTHMQSLSTVIGPINDQLLNNNIGMPDVVLEDNLSNHKTDHVLKVGGQKYLVFNSLGLFP